MSKGGVFLFFSLSLPFYFFRSSSQNKRNRFRSPFSNKYISTKILMRLYIYIIEFHHTIIQFKAYSLIYLFVYLYIYFIGVLFWQIYLYTKELKKDKKKKKNISIVCYYSLLLSLLLIFLF